MDIKVIDKEFAVCKINDVTEVNFNDEFCFVGKTDEELSLVCSSEFVPKIRLYVTAVGERSESRVYLIFHSREYLRELRTF